MHLDCMEYAGGRPPDVVHGGPAGRCSHWELTKDFFDVVLEKVDLPRRPGPEPPHAPIPAKPAEP
jgi:hypothetical protein